eukprot:2810018-Pyramimonas_sp.AAC.1
MSTYNYSMPYNNNSNNNYHITTTTTATTTTTTSVLQQLQQLQPPYNYIMSYKSNAATTITKRRTRQTSDARP